MATHEKTSSGGWEVAVKKIEQLCDSREYDNASLALSSMKPEDMVDAYRSLWNKTGCPVFFLIKKFACARFGEINKIDPIVAASARVRSQQDMPVNRKSSDDEMKASMLSLLKSTDPLAISTINDVLFFKTEESIALQRVFRDRNDIAALAIVGMIGRSRMPLKMMMLRPSDDVKKSAWAVISDQLSKKNLTAQKSDILNKSWNDALVRLGKPDDLPMIPLPHQLFHKDGLKQIGYIVEKLGIGDIAANDVSVVRQCIASTSTSANKLGFSIIETKGPPEEISRYEVLKFAIKAVGNSKKPSLSSANVFGALLRFCDNSDFCEKAAPCMTRCFIHGANRDQMITSLMNFDKTTSEGIKTTYNCAIHEREPLIKLLRPYSSTWDVITRMPPKLREKIVEEMMSICISLIADPDKNAVNADNAMQFLAEKSRS